MSNELRKFSPQFSIEQAKDIGKKFYDLDEFLREYPSERDQNFLFEKSSLKYLLKISNIDEEFSILDLQLSAMKCIGTNPRVIPSIQGNLIEIHNKHFIRLLNFIEGIPLADYQPHTDRLLFNLGQLLGNIDRSLSTLKHSSSNRSLYWNMINAEEIISKYKHFITNEIHLKIIEKILHEWIELILPRLSLFRLSIIHNDANDYNIIVQNENEIFLIDYGDMCETFLICELAIASAYVMLNKDHPIQSVCQLIRGYHSVYPLQTIEIDFIYYFIRIRLAMSVTISAHQKQIQPENSYLVISEKPIWNLLEKLEQIETDFVKNTFRSASS